jgi:large subunit ribosomal protein L10
MKKEDKGKIIEHLAAEIKKYPNFYLTDIATLNAERTSALRRECFKLNIKLIVVKNTLLKKALANLDRDFSALNASLKGNSAIMFSVAANVPARLIKEFNTAAKKEKRILKPELKAAYVQESFYIGADYLDALVNIKSKEELLGDLIMLLQSPVKSAISALKSPEQIICGVLKTLEER